VFGVNTMSDLKTKTEAKYHVVEREARAIHLRKKPLKTDFDNAKKNREVYGQLIYADEEDKVAKIDEGVYLVAGGDFFALVNENREAVEYYVSIGTTKVSKKPVLFQSLVWRDSSSKYTGSYKGYTSFAGYVFFEHIFPKSGFVIATDKEQTEQWQSFWFNRVRDAFRLGYHVYLVAKGKVVDEMNDFEQVRDLRDKVWAHGSYTVRLAISQDVIEIQPEI